MSQTRAHSSSGRLRSIDRAQVLALPCTGAGAGQEPTPEQGVGALCINPAGREVVDEGYSDLLTQWERSARAPRASRRRRVSGADVPCQGCQRPAGGQARQVDHVGPSWSASLHQPNPWAEPSAVPELGAPASVAERAGLYTSVSLTFARPIRARNFTDFNRPPRTLDLELERRQGHI